MTWVLLSQVALPNSGSPQIYPPLSPGTFIVSHFIFTFVICFQLTLWRMWGLCLNQCFARDCRVAQYRLFKRLSFFDGIAVAPLLKFSSLYYAGLFLVSLFCSINQFYESLLGHTQAQIPFLQQHPVYKQACWILSSRPSQWFLPLVFLFILALNFHLSVTRSICSCMLSV